MARMIPVGFDEATPPGEKDVFARLAGDPATADWIVLHSLDLSAHIRQVEGEIDFLIIVPGREIVVLEVKSHRSVKRGADGAWLLGADAPTWRGPFKQASQAMHSVRKRLVERDSRLSGILFCSAVCFPFVNFDGQSPSEWRDWQVIGNRDLRVRPISSSISRALDGARARTSAAPAASWFHSEREEPTVAQSAEVARLLRPEFELYESPSDRRERSAGELKRYTDEQYRALDCMETNQRVLFEGPAGTGKTLLALETARRSSRDGSRTLLCCYNRLLAEWMSREAEPLGDRVSVSTLHALMLSVAGVKPPAEAASDYWDRELPSIAVDRLLSGTGPTFDRVIVDEAQDICQETLLDFLDLSLYGGLASGEWRMFGDFERQSIYGRDGLPPPGPLLERVGQVTRYRLDDNCRNPPRIATFVGLIADADPYVRVLRPDSGVEPEVVFYESPAAQKELLVKILEGLRRDGYGGQDVVVLSRVARGAAAEGVIEEPWRSRLRRLGECTHRQQARTLRFNPFVQRPRGGGSSGNGHLRLGISRG